MQTLRSTGEPDFDRRTVTRSEEKARGGWARDGLLREARGSCEDAISTELVATRMLLINLLKPLALGERSPRPGSPKL
jgi:hypothetical protein